MRPRLAAPVRPSERASAGLARASLRRPRRSSRGAGCAGCRARGSRRSRCPAAPPLRRFARRRSSWARTESSDGTASAPMPRSASFAAVRTHQRSSASRRVSVGARPPRRARARQPAPRGRGRTTRCRRDARGARCRQPARPRTERLDGGRADVRIGIPGELDQQSPRRGRDTARGASRPRSARAGFQSRRRGTSRRPGTGASSSSSDAILDRGP